MLRRPRKLAADFNDVISCHMTSSSLTPFPGSSCARARERTLGKRSIPGDPYTERCSVTNKKHKQTKETLFKISFHYYGNLHTRHTEDRAFCSYVDRLKSNFLLTYSFTNTMSTRRVMIIRTRINFFSNWQWYNYPRFTRRQMYELKFK